jgi:SAM-dependent methyltransferase
MKLSAFLKQWAPPVLLAGFQRWRRTWDRRLGPEIHYAVVDTQRDALEYNARGTHLNESGDTRSIEHYLQTFEIEKELHNPDVADNLSFLDNIVSPLLPAQARVLDVGCGLGRYARFLRRAGAPTIHWRYAGVDRSETILRFARQFCPEVEFASTGDTVRLPYPDSSHDLVMASSMLQYTGDEWRSALREMRRVARRYLVISRLPLVRYSPSVDCRQTVLQGRQQHIHYLKILNRAEFEAGLAEGGCSIVARDYGTEVLVVEGVREPVVLNLYLAATPGVIG